MPLFAATCGSITVFYLVTHRALYDNLWEQVRDIRDLKGHPFVFYRKMGYTITGVVPDANGRGKPDILMSRRVTSPIGND